MKSEKITISEQGISLDQASQFLLKLIEDQITNYNEQQMAAWERNHLIAREESEAKMAYLKEQKNKLKMLLQEADMSTESVDFNFSLGIVIRSSHSIESN